MFLKYSMNVGLNFLKLLEKILLIGIPICTTFFFFFFFFLIKKCYLLLQTSILNSNYVNFYFFS